ncbi:MAG: hypothetical protein AAFZ52_09750, partial [Bacteroidota bacterium]
MKYLPLFVLLLLYTACGEAEQTTETKTAAVSDTAAAPSTVGCIDAGTRACNLLTEAMVKPHAGEFTIERSSSE